MVLVYSLKQKVLLKEYFVINLPTPCSIKPTERNVVVH